MNAAQAAKIGPVRLSSRRSVATPVRAATLRPRAVRGARLVVRAEKVVGIDLGTTNSAVSAWARLRRTELLCSMMGSVWSPLASENASRGEQPRSALEIGCVLRVTAAAAGVLRRFNG